MPEELGKIEKPAAAEFKGGRKVFFVPMVVSAKDLPLEYLVKVDNYWDEVESHLSSLESKLGPAKHVYQELVPQDGEEGIKLIQELNLGSYNVVRNRVDKGATFLAVENNDILSELMDWSRCLSVGLQSQKVFSKIYEFYNEANKSRNQDITTKLNETLKENETGILIMAEGHSIQFPADIKVFYVAPPSLDGIRRWMRDYEAKLKEQEAKNPLPGGDQTGNSKS
jgi:hypothetical protein